jgi:hypothetical protein
MLKVLTQLLQNAVNMSTINADVSAHNFTAPRECDKLAVVRSDRMQ